MSDERDIEILKYRIAELSKKIYNLRKNGISEIKVVELEMKKKQWVDMLAEIEVN